MPRHLSRAGGAASMRTRAAARLAPVHARWRSHLLDHPVGAQQDRGRYRYAERLCGTHVENGFELVCLLDGEVEGIDAFEDLVDEHGPRRHISSWSAPYPIRPPASAISLDPA